MEPTSAPLRTPAGRGRERGPRPGCCGRPAPGRTLAAALARTDADFRLKHRVAPVRQGPAGVLAYLLHEAERPGEVHAPDTRPEPRARGGSGVPDVTASYDPGSLPHQPP